MGRGGLAQRWGEVRGAGCGGDAGSESGSGKIAGPVAPGSRLKESCRAVISYEDAVALLVRAVKPRPPERRALGDALSCVTAQEIAALVDVPGFDNAAMDGYALPSAATAGASPATPRGLPVAGRVPAGHPPPEAMPESAWEIMTGAPLPDGCDTVLPVERFRAGLERLEFGQPAPAGLNIRRRGSDFRRGERVLPAGVRLEPAALMALAATGHDDVRVRPAVRVALLTTGSELAHAGVPSRPGQLRDTNGPFLRAALPRLGARVVAEASSPDEPGALAEALRAMAADCDLVVTTGGVSAGALDLVPGAVAATGAEILFHKVAIRPGKPVLAARLPTGALLLGLPGNPVAVAVGLRFFIAPLLGALLGRPPEEPTPAVAIAPIRRRGRLRFFAKARVETAEDGLRRLEILPGQESFRIAPLLDANAWAVIAEGEEDISAGTPVPTVPLLPD